MRGPDEAHSFAWKHHKREIQLRSRLTTTTVRQLSQATQSFSPEIHCFSPFLAPTALRSTLLVLDNWVAQSPVEMGKANLASVNPILCNRVVVVGMFVPRVTLDEHVTALECDLYSTVGSKTLICISFTKLNIPLLLERVFLNFSGYSLTATQLQANATKRLHKFHERSHFSRDAKRIYEKTCYSHASSVVSTVTPVSCDAT
ncbi:hypothetical protein CSKR_107186 [Clonorchis sinensis]|uniref:Uncharacterized protein n=1 Tax=Clonorchis sinensis TaxID=79923 RepID=A0A419QD32_CLOSI|nr:hypothetical protein CSKR_107186 [Clonorchis sinensis]